MMILTTCACRLQQGGYLYTVLIVAFDESIKSATRIRSLYSFTSVLVGLACGFIVRYVRRVKLFIIAVSCGNLLPFSCSSLPETGPLFSSQRVSVST